MTPPIPLHQSPDYRAAALSALVPGLGQTAQGRTQQALRVVAATFSFVACLWLTWYLAGLGSTIFVCMVFVLPWWVFQSYDASLGHTSPPNLSETLRIVWIRAHDIRYLGTLFLLTAVTDFYIIVANPSYTLTLFCEKPDGMIGLLAKAQSPTLHILIGYGFLRVRRWALFLYLAYAGFGFFNALANFACFGYGRIRSVFFVTLIAFTLYIWWRRSCFLHDRSLPASPARL